MTSPHRRLVIDSQRLGQASASLRGVAAGAAAARSAGVVPAEQRWVPPPGRPFDEDDAV